VSSTPRAHSSCSPVAYSFIWRASSTAPPGVVERSPGKTNNERGALIFFLIRMFGIPEGCNTECSVAPSAMICDWSWFKTIKITWGRRRGAADVLAADLLPLGGRQDVLALEAEDGLLHPLPERRGPPVTGCGGATYNCRTALSNEIKYDKPAVAFWTNLTATGVSAISNFNGDSFLKEGGTRCENPACAKGALREPPRVGIKLANWTCRGHFLLPAICRPSYQAGRPPESIQWCLIRKKPNCKK